MCTLLGREHTEMPPDAVTLTLPEGCALAVHNHRECKA